MSEENDDNLRDLVAQVSEAYFANSHVSVAEIGTVIERIAKSLGAVGRTPGAEPALSESEPVQRLASAQIRKSITPDAIISFEDGRPYRTLRRHLSARGLTPEQYREKWGLPADYPMVAPTFSEARSQMAKQLGLGARRKKAELPATGARRRRAKGAVTP